MKWYRIDDDIFRSHTWVTCFALTLNVQQENELIPQNI